MNFPCTCALVRDFPAMLDYRLPELNLSLGLAPTRACNASLLQIRASYTQGSMGMGPNVGTREMQTDEGWVIFRKPAPRSFELFWVPKSEPRGPYQFFWGIVKKIECRHIHGTHPSILAHQNWNYICQLCQLFFVSFKPWFQSSIFPSAGLRCAKGTRGGGDFCCSLELSSWMISLRELLDSVGFL